MKLNKWKKEKNTNVQYIDLYLLHGVLAYVCLNSKIPEFRFLPHCTMLVIYNSESRRPFLMFVVPFWYFVRFNDIPDTHDKSQTLFIKIQFCGTIPQNTTLIRSFKFDNFDDI